MSKLWTLHKARVIGLIALALISGYSLTGWLYFQFERNSPLTLGSTALTLGVLGLMLSLVLFFIIAYFMVTADRNEATDDCRDDDDFPSNRLSRKNEFTLDPVYNAVYWGSGLSLTPTDIDKT